MLTSLAWLLAASAIVMAARGVARARVGGALERRYAGRFGGLFAATALAFLLIFAAVLDRNGGVGLVASLFGGAAAAAASVALIGPLTRVRPRFEALAVGLLGAVAALAVVTTIGIFIVLIFESVRFFERVPLEDFLFGAAWSPQTAIRADQVASEGAFGVLPLVTGTLLITLIAVAVAFPVGVMAAIYLGTYARQGLRDAIKLVLELLAGVPTVVYGFFALLIIGPLISDAAAAVGAWTGVEVEVPAQNALAAGLVMGVMIIPFVSSLSDDVMSAIPPSLREGALALGATKSEAVLSVILPAAGPGLIGACLLAISRAIGETMIVVMAASRSANLTFNPLDRVTTFTVQIVALLTGDQEFDSAKTLAAFALGLLLFLATLSLNVVALVSVKQFRMRYE